MAGRNLFQRADHRVTLGWLRLVLSLILLEFSSEGFLPNQAEASEDVPPNIIIIFIDDLGYADIGPFTDRPCKTPHLDQMAREGRIFTDFHSATAVCSASRAALLTGCYPERVGILGALVPQDKIGIHPDELTLAELCKQRGYRTAVYGKWHLGHADPFLPLQQGFDEFFGLPYSNDMWPQPEVQGDPIPDSKKKYPPLPLYEGNRVVDEEVTADEQAQLTTWYTERAVDFIERNKAYPFFLYVPHTMVHVPIFVSEKYACKSGLGLYADVVMELDWSVGQILATLKREGLDEKTLVIFTSDNGPWLRYGDHAGSAGPLREGKGTMFEGGYRVPCIARWPGKIPADSRCDEFATTMDLLPTVARLLEVSLPSQRVIDGKDIWPLISGETHAQSPHEGFYCYFGGDLRAVRDSRWKLHFPHSYTTLAGRPGGHDGRPAEYEQAPIGKMLYDLKNDIGETTDVSREFPQVVDRLEKEAERARSLLGDRLTNRVGSENRPPGKVE